MRRILFSDGTLMVSTNCQNDRVWPGGHADADKKAGIKQRRKFSLESNGLVGCLFQGHNAFGDSR